MSLTGVSPLVTNWIELGLDWGFHWRPTTASFNIPAGEQVQIPSEDYTFEAPEGIVRTFNAVFDHPSCGIRYEAHPELDTGFFTITPIASYGISNMPFYLTTLIPPQTPPGIYVIAQNKEWEWKEWARLYVVNSDTISHRCLGYAYTILLLREPRPDDSIIPLQTLKKVQLAYEMYPEQRETLRSKLTEQMDAWVKELRPGDLLKEEE